MTIYLQRGSIPPKRHITHPQKPGFRDEGIYYEEVVTLAGFGRAYSICYHLRPPTRVKKIEAAGTMPLDLIDETELRHHHLRTKDISRRGSILTGRMPLLANDDVILSRCRPAEQQAELFRNASADEVYFIHRGRGELRTMFGVLPFREHDYVVIPRTTTYQMDFDAIDEAEILLIEATDNIVIPPHYLNPDGQIRLGAPYCERDLHGPVDLQVIDREDETPVIIKDGSRLTRYVMANHPFDVVGWDGMVYPFTFNADDFEPITGTIHQPPPIHLTFQTKGFVICTFAPRLLDTHPQAIKVPYAHSNVQADEVLYYVEGNFGSRRGVEQSSITLHPRGIPHGPHPGTIVASKPVQRTDELAVMVDTVKPLSLTRGASELEDKDYPYSWLE